MVAVALTSGRIGINRMRVKGGANPESLYDAVNCYVTASGSVRPRPGTVTDATLPPGTIGLMTYRGKLHVFSDQHMDNLPLGYSMSVLTQPNKEAKLKRLHFAEPFLGFPYVVAEWDDGVIAHYWLEGEGGELEYWQPSKVYRLGQVVHPTTPTGYVYRATRLGEPGRVWAPGMDVQQGDVVEPTAANGYKYEAVEVYGNPARTGSQEPAWATDTDAVTIEEADAAAASTSNHSSPATGVPPRYAGGGGGNREQSPPVSIA
ncbi:hypothetical protein CO610_07420 [Lysobacteraceae bacterium NML95-0200]|nr:hypothetical protein CO610_07420 [Xanthomonadaceae bacterium NML95-0200]